MKLEIAALGDSDQIAGAVEHRAFLIGIEVVPYEPCGCEVRPIAVASRHAGPANQELSVACEISVITNDIADVVRYGAANCDRRIRCERSNCADHGGLGRTIAIENGA